MFRKGLGLLAIFGFSLILVSTALAAGRYNLGAKAGIIYSSQKMAYDYPGSNSNGSYDAELGAGVYLERRVHAWLSVRAEGVYLRKKFAINMYNDVPDPIINDIWIQRRIDYISLNLLAKAAFRNGTFVMAGPRLDLRLDSNGDFAEIMWQGLEEKFSSRIFGLTFGLGHSFVLSQRIGLFIEGQYLLDMGKLYDKSKNGFERSLLKTIEYRSVALYGGVQF